MQPSDSAWQPAGWALCSAGRHSRASSWAAVLEHLSAEWVPPAWGFHSHRSAKQLITQLHSHAQCLDGGVLDIVEVTRYYLGYEGIARCRQPSADTHTHHVNELCLKHKHQLIMLGFFFCFVFLVNNKQCSMILCKYDDGSSFFCNYIFALGKPWLAFTIRLWVDRVRYLQILPLRHLQAQCLQGDHKRLCWQNWWKTPWVVQWPENKTQKKNILKMGK